MVYVLFVTPHPYSIKLFIYELSRYLGWFVFISLCHPGFLLHPSDSLHWPLSRTFALHCLHPRPLLLPLLPFILLFLLPFLSLSVPAVFHTPVISFASATSPALATSSLTDACLSYCFYFLCSCCFWVFSQSFLFYCSRFFSLSLLFSTSCCIYYLLHLMSLNSVTYQTSGVYILSLLFLLALLSCYISVMLYVFPLMPPPLTSPLPLSPLRPLATTPPGGTWNSWSRWGFHMDVGRNKGPTSTLNTLPEATARGKTHASGT